MLLGGSAAAAGVALILQVTRLRFDPNGAAVHGVALLVTFIVFAILLRLVRLQLAGPGLEAASWERHTHRASLREAPLVALGGAGVAIFVALATPRLIFDVPAATPTPVAVKATEPDHFARMDSVLPMEVSSPLSIEVARIPGGMTLLDSNPLSSKPLVEVNYRWLEGGQEEIPRDPMQEPVDPTRPGRDSILRVQQDELPLPPVHFGVGAIVATTRGNLDLSGDTGRFEVDLESVGGEQTFEMGLDVTVEFPLTQESSLKIIYGGVAMLERGHLNGDTAFGSATATSGDRFEFELRWSHLYMALSKRLMGYTRDSWFDFSVHLGAMVDHTLAEFEVEGSGVAAESEDGERGWVAPGAGFSMTVRGAGVAGFVLEVVQSAPLNIGGQAVALTDVRSGLTLDITEGTSFFVGYRYVKAVYRLFDSPWVREDGTAAAALAMQGPVFGLDFRF